MVRIKSSSFSYDFLLACEDGLTAALRDADASTVTFRTLGLILGVHTRTASASCSRVHGLDELPGRLNSVSSALRRASRARESLDITVPIGIPITSDSSR